MKLSIIIPVYNVEQYVEKCILSCVCIGVDAEEYEIIVVNDGSTDKGLELVLGLAQRFDYINVVSQENQGLSAARNAGLDIAKGDYVWFVDSDDWIVEGVIPRIMSALIGQDILCLGYEIRTEPNLVVQEKHYMENLSISGREFFVKGFDTPIPFHVFRKEFLLQNKLFFYRGIFHEDSEFMPRALWLANNVSVFNDIAYCYRIRQNSITTTINPKKGYDYIFVAYQLSEFFKHYSLTKLEISAVSNYISQMITNGLHNSKKMNSEQRKAFNKYVHSYQDIYGCFLSAKQLKYRVFGVCAKLFPHNMVELYLAMSLFK